jgi:hypothetical protein
MKTLSLLRKSFNYIHDSKIVSTTSTPSIDHVQKATYTVTLQETQQDTSKGIL